MVTRDKGGRGKGGERKKGTLNWKIKGRKPRKKRQDQVM